MFIAWVWHSILGIKAQIEVEIGSNLPFGKKLISPTVAMHVGQAELPALEAIREPLVIDAEQVQHGPLPVVKIDGFPLQRSFQLYSTVSEFIT